MENATINDLILKVHEYEREQDLNQKVKRAKFKEFDSESRKNLLTYPYIDRINQIINYKGNYLYLNHKFGYLVSINDKDGNYDETILETIGDDLEEILKSSTTLRYDTSNYENNIDLIEFILKNKQLYQQFFSDLIIFAKNWMGKYLLQKLDIKYAKYYAFENIYVRGEKDYKYGYMYAEDILQMETDTLLEFKNSLHLYDFNDIYEYKVEMANTEKLLIEFDKEYKCMVDKHNFMEIYAYNDLELLITQNKYFKSKYIKLIDNSYYTKEIIDYYLLKNRQ